MSKFIFFLIWFTNNTAVSYQLSDVLEFLNTPPFEMNNTKLTKFDMDAQVQQQVDFPAWK